VQTGLLQDSLTLEGRATGVPVTRLLCTDEDVLGAPFYVMDRVPGYVIRSEMPPGYADTPELRETMSRSLIEVLAAIHAVEIPGRLDGFGRPEGYLERQLRRWVRQWEASRAAELPELDALAADLTRTRPQQSGSTLVHGDYRLDNTIMDPVDPSRVAAVLDWELSTLGDPLADVGLLGDASLDLSAAHPSGIAPENLHGSHAMRAPARRGSQTWSLPGTLPERGVPTAG